MGQWSRATNWQQRKSARLPLREVLAEVCATSATSSRLPLLLHDFRYFGVLSGVRDDGPVLRLGG